VDPSTSERRTVGILSADICGYSRLMADDEEATVRTVSRYREEIELHVAQHRGQMEFTGDNFLAEFPSAADAVRCAIEIQRVLGALNADLPPNRRMDFRIGGHVGDVRFEGSRVFGTGVNIAARIEPLAEPGGLSVSQAVIDQLRGVLDLPWKDCGEHTVKNIPRPVRVFALQMDARPAAPPETAARNRTPSMALAGFALLAILVLGGWWLLSKAGPAEVALSPIRSIAVLPLENLSGNPEQEYFSDGMTEALIGDLARISNLGVISRTSVMQYKRARKPLPEIARELGVEGIIEGTVAHSGDRVRVTVQLIDARSDQHLWSERYERDLSDVLALQGEVARAVAEQVRIELTPAEERALQAPRSVNPEAYDAYLQGLHLRGPMQLAGIWGPQSIAAFSRAVELDPTFAEAWAELAMDHLQLGWSVGFDRSAFPRARELAEKALALDDRLGRGHSIVGHAKLWADWDFEGAEQSFVRAVEASPGDPHTLDAYSWYLLMIDKRDEAIALTEQTLRIAPLDLYMREAALRHFYLGRDFDRALQELDRVRELDPSWVAFDLVNLYFLLDRKEDAYQSGLELDRRCGPPCESTLQARERGWTAEGWNGMVRAWTASAIEGGVYPPYFIAAQHVMAGDADAAFEWLERGVRERDPFMTLLKADPIFDRLRTDARLQTLLGKIGFPEG
jgi:adenylate cyclase